ncbi:MAG: hypothetical protein MJE63_01015 [Proteobacteria bacterium]|nr:hypothetical protein [Pseudomonadota bacterium]
MTDTTETMVIIRCGNYTPLGERAATSACSVRAGFTAMVRSKSYKDKSWEPVRIAVLADLNLNRDIWVHFRALALPALKEALQPLVGKREHRLEIPVIIGLPEPRPGLPKQLGTGLAMHLSQLSLDLNLNLDFEFIEAGHTSGAIALQSARKKLKHHPFCVIGGVDSYLETKTLRWLETETKRLKCGSNKNGFTPGQAAGFCLVSNQTVAKQWELEPEAIILAEAETKESSPFESGKFSTGLGLSSAIQQVLKTIPKETKIDQVYATLNGERYTVQDFGYAVLNIGSRIGNPGECIAPHQCWGDIGAAAIPTLISLAVESGRKGYAKGPYNLITAGSLGNSRASVLLELENKERVHWSLGKTS